MAKPIVVMYIPREGYFSDQHGWDETWYELTRILNGNFGEQSSKDKRTYPLYWTDYYWLVFPKEDIPEPELQVFYEKDFTPIKFEELKKFIEDALNNRNQESALQK
jgi:hypothetical protein